MVSQALLAHSAGCSEDQRCKCSMLNVENSPWVQALFLILMRTIDLLWLQVFIRFSIGWQTLTSKNADRCCSQKPRAWISNLASCALLDPLLNCSPETSRRTGSVSTSLQTVLRSSASRSLSSLWLNGQGPIPQHNTFTMSANVFTISKESKFLQRATK